MLLCCMPAASGLGNRACLARGGAQRNVAHPRVHAFSPVVPGCLSGLVSASLVAFLVNCVWFSCYGLVSASLVAVSVKCVVFLLLAGLI